ncbi:MAG: C25 family cysteine peptidase, partial [Flavobacteriales bacterium]|nr:C25 family cysteine peptidase [Flavobacteriales bacterium]
MKFTKIILAFLAVLAVNVNAKDIKLTETTNQFVITSKSLSEFTFVSHLSEISTMRVKKDANEFLKLIVGGYGENAKKGNAELPVLEELINVPFGSTVAIKILNKEETTISLSDYGIDNFIFPSQPSISKGENAEDVPFYFNEEYYNYDGFYTNDLITTELLGKMRGQQLARLSVAPFSYNPTTNELKVVTKLEVKIIFKNIDSEGHKTNKQKYYSPEFNNLFKECINYIPSQEKDVITTYPVKYVIISDPAFESTLQPFIDWKTKKGFIVVEGYTNDPNVGNTTTSIHAFIKDMYDNPIDGIAPTYLLIVGDDGQVPSFDNGQHLSDMYYCEFDGGGDFYPEMYYGRFSATIPEEVQVQVEKTITHEQYTFTDPSFLDEVVLVAGVDASMAPTYGNGQINYGTDNYFNVAHGLTVYNYLYGSGTPITSDMPQASAAIIADVSAGVGFANYTAHCGSSGWSDPSFSTSDISGLQNFDEYGVMVGNCCQSNKFDVPVCFGEGLLRADNKGAVGYIGGSNNTYWNEDFWWAVGNGSISANPTYAGTGLAVFDCLMHENGEQQADWFITTGQMLHSGNLAVTQAGGSEQYYWEIYHIMGDPSLMPYIGVPTLLTVSHNAATPVGTTTFTVNTEENAYVAISMNGVLLDAQLADVTGIVNLSFPAIANVGVADIVITKQFKQPYQGTVQIISPTGPYVIYSSNTIDDSAGNNNQQVDYDEFISMNVEVENVGSVDATSVTVTISTSDPNVTLMNSSDVINLVSAQQTISINNPFTFQVANDVADQHIVTFDLIMTDNQGNTWNSTLNIVINAPVLNHAAFTIDDGVSGNGVLDAGETLDLIVDVTNIGHADINTLTATMGCLSSYVTVNSTTSNVSSLAVNSQQSTTFNITIDANTPNGTLAQFPFDVTNGNYTHNTTFNETIGIINEDYETGDFTQYAWVNDPLYPWTIDIVNVYEGTNSSKSAAGLPDSEVSHLDINVDVTAPGDISFWKFVSSEQDYDYLQFYIDGNKQGEWSGIDNSWSFVSFPVTVGN